MRWKALLALVVVFLLGLGGGVFLDRLYLRPSGWQGKYTRVVEHLSERLGLSDKQRSEMQAILRETRSELLNLRIGWYENVDRVLAKSGDRIRLTLNSDQVKKFDEIVKENQEQRQRHRRQLLRRLSSSP